MFRKGDVITLHNKEYSNFMDRTYIITDIYQDLGNPQPIYVLSDRKTKKEIGFWNLDTLQYLVYKLHRKQPRTISWL